MKDNKCRMLTEEEIAWLRAENKKDAARGKELVKEILALGYPLILK